MFEKLLIFGKKKPFENFERLDRWLFIQAHDGTNLVLLPSRPDTLRKPVIALALRPSSIVAYLWNQCQCFGQFFYFFSVCSSVL